MKTLTIKSVVVNKGTIFESTSIDQHDEVIKRAKSEKQLNPSARVEILTTAISREEIS